MNKKIFILLLCILFNCNEFKDSTFNCNDVSSMSLIPLISYKFEKLASYSIESSETDSIMIYN